MMSKLMKMVEGKVVARYRNIRDKITVANKYKACNAH